MQRHSRRISLIMISVLVTVAWTGIAGAEDLTPSVNYFNFDYGTVPMSSQVDSIIAGRYEVLVADGSYGSGYVSKYNELYALDPQLRFYVYHNFNDPYYSCAGLPPVNEWVGPRMEADGEDSTSMYWHSHDYTPTSFGAYSAYSTSEYDSRLLTYNGTRALINNTNLNFLHHFVDYAEMIVNRHSGRMYSVSGLWFDNMSIPQTVGVSTSTPGRHIHEPALGGPTAQYGAWTISEWQQAFKDTVLIKYTSILADSLKNRLGIDVCINALAWAYGDKDSYAAGYQPEYFDGSLVKPVHREFEFGLSPHDHNQQLLYPGPTNSVSSINTATVAADYSPVSIYQGLVDCSQEGVENWFNPGHGYLEYPFRIYWYDCLALYYLTRARTTYISFANVPENRLGVLNWLDGGGSDGMCVAAGTPGDSCYWIDALGVRVGRDGNDPAWDTDQVEWYVASVDCDDCVITEGQGKDSFGQNWVIFRRTWTGDDGYRYMVLLRPAGQQQNQWAGSHSPTFELLDGPWQKLSHNGAWGASQATESFENGRAGIYRSAADGNDCAVPSSPPTLASPDHGSGVATTQPTLCVHNSTPAAGCTDDQTYHFEVYSDSTLSQLVHGPGIAAEGASQSCYTVSSSLESGRWYWWRTRVYNGTSYSAWMGPYKFHTPNQAPAVPTPVAPADGSQIDESQPTFEVGGVTDPDGTPVLYRFEVSRYSNFSSLVASREQFDDTDWAIGTPLDNDTYYWRARTDDGIDISSYCTPCQFTVQIESNNPPSLTTIVEPGPGGTVTDSTVYLVVQNGDDPDGDALTYFFELYDGPGTNLLASSGTTPEGAGSTTGWQVPIVLSDGATYSWRARCYDGINYSAWTSLSSFQVDYTDYCATPPSVPELSSPPEGTGVASVQPQLCVVNSTPAPGCTEDQTYQFSVYSDESLTELVAGPISTAEGAGTSCATVVPALSTGSIYYWQARAYNGTSYSGWAGPFSFHTPNTAPPTPSPSSPVNGATVDTRRPTLTVGTVTDPDGTPVTYHFEVANSPSFSSLVLSGATSSNSWQCSESLNEATYYWRSRVYDGITYSGYSAGRSFTVSLATNQAPPPPDHLSPADGETVTDTPITVTVINAADPDGDDVYYDFYVYSDAAMTQLVEHRHATSTGAGGTTSADFFTTFLPINNQLYYWHVVANDQQDWSDPSSAWSFRYFSFATDVDDYVPVPVSPVSQSVVSRRPTLTIENIAEPGSHEYFFEVSTDSSFMTSAASGSTSRQDGPTTSWQAPTPLEAGRAYYWRARADNYDYSRVASFTISDGVYAYPNPVSLSEGPVTFRLPNDPVDILIQTVSGQTVLIRDGVSGEWQWDGHNGNGHVVSPGVYFWYLRGSDEKGKLVVKP